MPIWLIFCISVCSSFLRFSFIFAKCSVLLPGERPNFLCLSEMVTVFPKFYSQIASHTAIVTRRFLTKISFGHLCQIALCSDSFPFWVLPSRHLSKRSSEASLWKTGITFEMTFPESGLCTLLAWHPGVSFFAMALL